MCEYNEFYRESPHVARKEHKCCETGRLIQPGERYWRCRMKFDGDFREYVQCEGAYHFARYLNLILNRSEYLHGDGCVVEFRGIAEYVAEWRSEQPEIADEWDRVRNGHVTRDSSQYESRTFDPKTSEHKAAP